MAVLESEARVPGLKEVGPGGTHCPAQRKLLGCSPDSRAAETRATSWCWKIVMERQTVLKCEDRLPARTQPPPWEPWPHLTASLLQHLGVPHCLVNFWEDTNFARDRNRESLMSQQN